MHTLAAVIEAPTRRAESAIRRGFACDFGPHLFVAGDRARNPEQLMSAGSDRTGSGCDCRPFTSVGVLARRGRSGNGIWLPVPVIVGTASADVGVSIRTWYGAIFPSVLTSTHDLASCRIRGSQEVCFERFPLLEAQRAGTWTVVASKRSGPAAAVRVVIAFAKP